MSDDAQTRTETAELMRQYQSLLLGEQFEEWIELWTDDAVCEFPFAAEGQPRRLEGKPAILEYMSAFPARISIERVDEMTSHPGLDPSVLITELRVTGTAVETGKPYPQQYVIVARARDGRLAHYREYWNPLVSAEAFSS